MEVRWYRQGAEEVGARQLIVADPDGYLVRCKQSLGSRSAAAPQKLQAGAESVGAPRVGHSRCRRLGQHQVDAHALLDLLGEKRLGGVVHATGAQAPQPVVLRDPGRLKMMGMCWVPGLALGGCAIVMPLRPGMRITNKIKSGSSTAVRA